jgi:hypothetical protein
MSAGELERALVAEWIDGLDQSAVSDPEVIEEGSE